MIRTQIQLSEAQAAALKALSIRAGLSMAELVRRGVDHILDSGAITLEERRRRALEAVGQFHSGLPDLAVEHDKYLDEQGW